MERKSTKSTSCPKCGNIGYWGGKDEPKVCSDDRCNTIYDKPKEVSLFDKRMGRV
jgi:hypothetical protein